MQDASENRFTKASDVFTREELAALSARSDLRGAWAVASTWGVIGITFAALARWPNPGMLAVALVVLGGRQLALSILMHEAAHRTLFRTRWLNDVLTDWTCARLMWNDVARYRRHHLGHHNHTGTPLDPDRSLVESFPTTRASLARKLLRDAAGITGIKRILGLVLMDAGVLEYTVAADARRRPRGDRTAWDYVREGAGHMAGVLVTNAVLAGVLAESGHPRFYLVWVLAYMTTFSVFLRIRSFAEHACTEQSTDILRNTRTTRAGLLARATVAPVRVNYHLEHHLLVAVPYYRLRKMHRMLRERGVVLAPPGYADVIALVSSVPAATAHA
jgi:fatty acid desaturase